MMDTSNAVIYCQLVSDYGDEFISEEASYAVDNLEQEKEAVQVKCGF